MISVPQRNVVDEDDPKGAVRLWNDFTKSATNGLAGIPGRVTRNVTFRAPARWITATLAHSWVAYDAAVSVPGFYKDPNGRVWLRGAAKTGVYGALSIFTLPDGYFPALAIPGIATTQTNATFDGEGRIAISAAGVVTAPVITSIQTGTSTFLSLEGISFDALNPTPQVTASLVLSNLGLAKPATSLRIAACADLTSNIPGPLPVVSWQVSGRDSVQITQLAGLLPSHNYALRVEIESE